uniref:Uncharacterized protein n=1 Tax=Fagus sylvatica TaxID=28930 RepID=A0A2N9FQ48_FAGSY
MFLLLSGFSEGESVMKKRKKGEEEAEVTREQQALIQTEPSVTKSSSKKGKGKDSRAPQKATGHVSHKRKHQKELPVPWRCEFYVDGRPMNEDDSVWKSKDVRGGQIADAVGSALLLPKDMKAWKGSNSTQMIENLKRDSVVAEINKLRAELAEARTVAHNAENAAQAFYDQGFEEATGSLRLQLCRECNIYFLKRWVSALEQVAVDDSSELYILGREYRPFNSGTPENLEEVNVEGLKDFEAVENPMDPEAVEVLGHEERVQTEEVQDVEKGISDKEDNVNIDG